MSQPLTYRGAPHHDHAPTLNINKLTVAYPSTGHPLSAANRTSTALDSISFTAEKGEQIAIIGPNGAGKSTLLKVIAGILKPDQGTVEMFGHAPSQHICIAYVSQRSEIDWQFPVTVFDVVMMGRTKQIGLFRWPSKRDRDRVYASLERVNASHLANEQIGELSGGQQQRVFIARALAQETDLLLLDEPLRGVDAPSQQAILAILKSLRPDGVTVLMTTHDLNIAADHFDRIMLINQQIVACGPPTAVLTNENLLTAYSGQTVLR